MLHSVHMYLTLRTPLCAVLRTWSCAQCSNVFDTTLMPLLLLCCCPAEPLHEVAAGKFHLTLTLTNPTIDCSLTEAGDNFRLVQYIQESRLLGIITGRHSAPSAAAGKSGGSSAQRVAAAAKIQSHPIDVSEAAALEEDSATAAAATAAPPGASSLTSAIGAKRAGDDTSAKAAAGQHNSAADEGKQSEGAGPALPANFIQRLAQADATSHVSAELRLPMLSVYIPDGQLLMPKELA